MPAPIIPYVSKFILVSCDFDLRKLADSQLTIRKDHKDHKDGAETETKISREAVNRTRIDFTIHKDNKGHED
jgi:hypothetical protein